jgi:hypothetical protein
MKGIFLFIVISMCFLCVKSQDNFDYYISNTGSDLNSGNTKLAPKKTIAGVAAVIANGALPVRPLTIGLRGAIFSMKLLIPAFLLLQALTLMMVQMKNLRY